MTNDVSTEVTTDETVPPDVMEEFTELMDDLAAKQRDPSIPEGTEIGTGNIEGMPAAWKKQSSMHHLDGQPLPDRLPLYRYPTNEIAMVPTSLVFKRLSRVDNGHKTWSRKPFTDATPIEYIEREVATISGGTMTKRFIDEAAYESWMKGKDPDRWESILRQADRAERDEDRVEQRALAAALLAAAGGDTPQVGATPPMPWVIVDHLDPEGLKALADEFNIELSDRRSHEKMRSELRVALGGEA